MGGYAASYGRSENLSYTFNSVNALTQVVDADESTYLATVSCDANGNITAIEERTGNGTLLHPYNYLYSTFEYDALNRLLEHKDKRYVAGGTNAWVWTKRSHEYDAVGRLVASNLKSWNDGGSEPAGDSLEHCYAGSRHIQNYDGSSSYGARWHWAGAQNDHGAPLRAPSADSSAQQTYYTPSAGGAGDPQRRSFVIGGTSEGDQRLLYAQGRPMAKDSSGSGSNWATGTNSAIQTQFQTPVESRFFFTGTVTPTDMSRATDKREKDRLGIFGTSNSYAGSYGRVTSEPIGRDLNPLGRGSGMAFVAGGMNLGVITTRLATTRSAGGTGNSINNPCGLGGGGCGSGDGGNPPGSSDPVPSDEYHDTVAMCIYNCYEQYSNGEQSQQWLDTCILNCRTIKLDLEQYDPKGWMQDIVIVVCPEQESCGNADNWRREKCWNNYFDKSKQSYKEFLTCAIPLWTLVVALILSIALWFFFCSRIPTPLARLCCFLTAYLALVTGLCLLGNELTKCRNALKIANHNNVTDLLSCIEDSCIEYQDCLISAGCIAPACKIVYPLVPVLTDLADCAVIATAAATIAFRVCQQLGQLGKI